MVVNVSDTHLAFEILYAVESRVLAGTDRPTEWGFNIGSQKTEIRFAWRDI